MNGQNEQSVELDIKPYTDKNYVYYSIADGQAVDREPASETRDILFTRYIAMIEGTTPYTVTGVLNVFNTDVAEYTSVAPEFEQWNMEDVDTSRSVIGYDWKNPQGDVETGDVTYTMLSPLSYIIREKDKNIFYKLGFTDFYNENGRKGYPSFEYQRLIKP